ncbi:MAG: rane fusion protein multidrug efflux system, partial [Pseudomonadota bacterium]|nr:rane fusion protein multidrug efflux system [Pseudomonadota bacterium]
MKTALLATLCALLTTTLPGCGKQEAPAAPLLDVKVATVLQKEVPIFIEAVGQTRGSTEIEVRARVEGYLQTVNYREGYPVKKGDLLYTIDPQPLAAALARARGLLA